MDSALRGALRPRDVLEVVAEAGAVGAATRVLLTAAASAAVAGVAVLLIDAGGRVDGAAVEAAVRRRLLEVGATHVAPRQVVTNVLLQRVSGATQLLLAIKALPEVMEQHNSAPGAAPLRLLIIDAVGSSYWTERAAATGGGAAAARPPPPPLQQQQQAQQAPRSSPLALHSAYPALARDVHGAARALQLAVMCSRPTVYRLKPREVEAGALFAEFLPHAWQQAATHRLVLSEAPCGGGFDRDAQWSESRRYVASWDRPTRLSPRQFVFNQHGGGVRMIS